MADYHIMLMAGDGVGPEVIAEGRKVLEAVGRRFGHTFSYREATVGGAAIDAYSTALRAEDLEAARGCDAILFGAVGGPKWDDPAAPVRPEQGLLALRKGLGLFANLRPVTMFPALVEASTLRAEIVQDVDLIVVRELTGGIYFGQPSERRVRADGGREAVDTMIYGAEEIERVVRLACELARGRRQRVTSVDKANVLSTSRLWREVATEVGREFPDVTLEHTLVDSAAMALIRHPRHFDVIVTENMFGDILTDEAAMLAGSMGMLPSASLNGQSPARAGSAGKQFGLYEPIHGSAPDIAGRGLANPVAMILSAAMLLRLSLGLEREAAAVEAAARAALDAGLRTTDIASKGMNVLSTAAMGDAIVERL